MAGQTKSALLPSLAMCDIRRSQLVRSPQVATRFGADAFFNAAALNSRSRYSPEGRAIFVFLLS